jgi:hypothetical protein
MNLILAHQIISSIWSSILFLIILEKVTAREDITHFEFIELLKDNNN